MSISVFKFRAALLTAAVLSLAGCQASNAESAPSKKTTQKVDVKSAATPAEPKLKLQTISEDLHVIFGPGGNIGVSLGPDGVVIVDDKFAANGDEILSLLKGLTDEPLRFVINTHYHGDHTGSNGQMKSVGATVVAHDNVRQRMSMAIENKLFKRTVEPAPKDHWPSLTFSDDMNFHMNGQTVSLHHAPGHTDGDSLVYFKDVNVIHMGDNYFNGLFPYIDIDAGGSVQGMIAAHDKALSMSDENTQIIPGHGPMSTREDLKQARDMLVDIMARVESRIAAGETLETILDSNILLDYADYASFIDEKNMIRIAHRSLTRRSE